MKIRIAVLALLLSLYGTVCSAQDDLSLCRIAASPSKYSGKIVQIRAKMYTVLDKNATFRDKRCPRFQIIDVSSYEQDDLNIRNFSLHAFPTSLGNISPGEYDVDLQVKIILFKSEKSVLLPFDKEEKIGFNIIKVLSYKRKIDKKGD